MPRSSMACSAQTSTASTSTTEPDRAWRLILGAGIPRAGAPEPLPGARNMAVDQALFESVQRGGRPVLRFYRWRPACLSFGRNQAAHGIYDPARAAALGFDLVRRPTGGLAVLHAEELTYAAILPAGPGTGPRETYRRINRALAEGLSNLGVPAELAGPDGAPTQGFASSHPCFDAPAPGEVVAAGRKLIGSAQRVERRTILQHGSILLAGTQDRIHDVQTLPGAAPPTVRATSLGELIAEPPSVPRLIETLARSFAQLFGIALAPAALDRAEQDRAAELEQHFADASWTWRR